VSSGGGDVTEKEWCDWLRDWLEALASDASDKDSNGEANNKAKLIANRLRAVNPKVETCERERVSILHSCIYMFISLSILSHTSWNVFKCEQGALIYKTKHLFIYIHVYIILLYKVCGS
jgi:hypothetical protein